MEASVLGLFGIQIRVPPRTGKFCSESKTTRGRSATPSLRSSFRAPFSHGTLPNKRAQLRVQPVSAASVGDKGPSNSGVSKNNIFDLLSYIFKLGLGILSQKKDEYEKLEEKVEHVVDVVEEVADEVRQVAKLTEEIAEKVEGESAKDGKIHRVAELIHEISDAVAQKAEIVEKQAENIEETLKAIDNEVDNVEDVVEDFAKSVSTVGKDYDTSVKAEKSTVEVKSS